MPRPTAALKALATSASATARPAKNWATGTRAAMTRPPATMTAPSTWAVR